jgi:hypothetical protein
MALTPGAVTLEMALLIAKLAKRSCSDLGTSHANMTEFVAVRTLGSTTSSAEFGCMPVVSTVLALLAVFSLVPKHLADATSLFNTLLGGVSGQ